MSFERINRKRRKERQNVSAFAALIASPAEGAFTMPAGGRLRFVAPEGAVEGDTAAILVGPTTRTIKIGATSVVIDWVERDVEVTPESGFGVDVHTGHGRWARIALVSGMIAANVLTLGSEVLILNGHQLVL